MAMTDDLISSARLSDMRSLEHADSEPEQDLRELSASRSPTPSPRASSRASASRTCCAASASSMTDEPAQDGAEAAADGHVQPARQRREEPDRAVQRRRSAARRRRRRCAGRALRRWRRRRLADLFPDRARPRPDGRARRRGDHAAARGPDGRLGVRSGGRARRPLSVVVQISTPDADSFRRSEAQVSAALARAVARGSRAL